MTRPCLTPEPVRLDPYRLLLPRAGDMLVDATVYASEAISIERDSIAQLRDAASVPSVDTVLATPDIHVGYGVPIGCVMATGELVSPAAVGYDINCGMRLIATPLEAAEVADDLEDLARSIRRDVPLGEGKKNLRLPPDGLELVLERGLAGLGEVHGESLGRYGQIRRADEDARDAERAEDAGCEPGVAGAVSARARERGASQLGTLGGGNHFIELQVVDRVDDADAAAAFGLRAGQLVVMIHTGSRGLGHQVAGDYMKSAKKLSGRDAPSPHLTLLRAEEPEGRRYLGAMFAAANFAFANRQVIAAYVRHAIRARYGGNLDLPLVYDVAHNMVKREEHGAPGQGRAVWVHRKGATRAFPPGRMHGTPFARSGQPVLIPGSMGTASYLLLADAGAAETLYSVNHGAGRVMSRTAAAGKRTRGGRMLKPGAISHDDLRRAMEGILLVAEDPAGALEEAPQAYKDIDQVVETVTGAGLARVVARMRSRAVLKG